MFKLSTIVVFILIFIACSKPKDNREQMGIYQEQLTNKADKAFQFLNKELE